MVVPPRRLWVVVSILAVVLIGLAAYLALAGRDRGATADLEKGLVGYWRFEDSADRAADSSGNDNTGVYVNSVAASNRKGHALQLAGDGNSHVSIPASKSLGKFRKEISVSAWVLPTTLPQDFRVVVSRQIGNLVHPDQFYLGFGPAGGSIHYKWHLGTWHKGEVNDVAIYAGDPIAGKWVNLIGVYDGKRIKLYVNGKKIGTHAMSGKIQVDDNPVTIGAEENGTEPRVVDGEFSGEIDEVRIYNRPLSLGEIKAIYKQRRS